MENVLMEINNSIFSHNNATFGGAIFITSSLFKLFFLIYLFLLAKIPLFIQSSTFANNNANQGGAIFFTKLPFYQNNCKFRNNQANYGIINGSYPFRLKLSDTTLNQTNYTYFLSDMPTGVLIPITLQIEVCDMYLQKINTLNEGYITVNLLPDENFSGFQTIEGITVQKIINGTAIFDHLMFFSNPVNITHFLKFSSPIIDDSIFDLTSRLMVMEKYEILNKSSYIMKLPIHLRECVPGEIYDLNNSICSICPVLSYSFNPLTEKCKECPLISDCFGGMNLSLHPGYWRSSIYSDLFVECEPFPESCLFNFLYH